jgi:hypothetical protein
MAQGEGIRQVGWLDCAGGGQVVLDRDRAYIGHMDAPHGTSVVDVSDPKHPRITASVDIPPGLHSHKVRVANDLMLVNRERTRGDLPNADFVGLRVFDVSKPDSPRDIHHWKCTGTGVHRFTFDGRYAYISAEQEGYVGTIVMILDFATPDKPEEVGRWWMPGQWIAGGETPSWKGRNHRCHHPIRRGDRLYVSYWYGGGVILDISDMSKPRTISTIDWSPPFGWPTHSLVPIDVPIAGHKWMLVADEHVQPLDPKLSPELPAMVWMVNITDETNPVPVSTFQLPELVGRRLAADDGVSSAGRNDRRKRGARGMVRQWPENYRHQQPAGVETGRVVDAGRAARRPEGVQQRRVCRPSRTDLSDRPQSRPVDP